ncbi:hypothetical protein MGYG_02850 [Nannizzia gypsea CBS 118893]|uniref:Uncharacterized protein n=1 Tax=Arthroderma gypseum (strain ATCC MYA-4604 / CBS 118893) TaxID=535722 RepID=E4UPB2_ARTGP|nr:hypothetical protein MGYG_02850 [Nannizzia gypsea CBS 118893]EFQ99838.1 hypothetical protein MGYG_02850 [Nannizzia gypsea CBS 118893]
MNKRFAALPLCYADEAVRCSSPSPPPLLTLLPFHVGLQQRQTAAVPTRGQTGRGRTSSSRLPECLPVAIRSPELYSADFHGNGLNVKPPTSKKKFQNGGKF